MIEIIQEGCMEGKFAIYVFISDENEITGRLTCGICGQPKVEYYYYKIIRQLQQAGLLPEDYPLMCCKCFGKQREKENEQNKNSS